MELSNVAQWPVDSEFIRAVRIRGLAGWMEGERAREKEREHERERESEQERGHERERTKARESEREKERGEVSSIVNLNGEFSSGLIF